MEPFDDLSLDSPPDISAALAHAFDRTADFMAAQRAGEGGITVEAVNLLQESVGISDAARVLLRERLGEIVPRSAPGQVLFGLIVGLMAAEAARSDADQAGALR